MVVAVGFIARMIFSYGVGYLAEKRGKSFIGFFLLSLIISPLIMLIAVYCMKRNWRFDKRTNMSEEQIQLYLEQVPEAVKAECEQRRQNEKPLAEFVDAAVHKRIITSSQGTALFDEYMKRKR